MIEDTKILTNDTPQRDRCYSKERVNPREVRWPFLH